MASPRLERRLGIRFAGPCSSAGSAPVTAPVPAKGLNADRLARAIDAADKDSVFAKATALAVSVAQENGLKTAVTAIEDLVRSCAYFRMQQTHRSGNAIEFWDLPHFAC